MAVMLVSPDTRTGTRASAVPPLPSSPRFPVPQARTVRSVRSAYAVLPAAARAVTLVSPDTRTGTGLLAVPPLPSCPQFGCPTPRRCRRNAAHTR